MYILTATRYDISEHTENTVMRWIWKSSLFTCILLITGPIESNASSFQAGGGLDLSVGQFGERTKPGWHIRGGWGPTIFSSQNNRFDAIINSSYSNFKTEISHDGDYAIIKGGVDLRLMFDLSANSQYYLIAGGGVASVKVKEFEFNETLIKSMKETGPFLSAGVGIGLGKIQSVRPFVEFRFTDISGTHLREYQMFELTVGLLK